MKVNWSERAALELAETAAYVALEFGRQASVDMCNSIHEAVDNIARFPMIGKTSFSDDKNGIEFRELACRLSSVVYAIYSDEVYIVSIWSNRQDRNRLYKDLRQISKTM